MKSAATSLLTISGHLDGIQITCSHHTMKGGGIFSRLVRGVLNVLLVQVLGYCWEHFNPTSRLKA